MGVGVPHTGRALEKSADRKQVPGRLARAGAHDSELKLTDHLRRDVEPHDGYHVQDLLRAARDNVVDGDPLTDARLAYRSFAVQPLCYG